MSQQLSIAKSGHTISLFSKMANRHGLIAGATGTGKTVSLQVIVEQLSSIGVPTFVSDVKGDFSGISQVGGTHPKVLERVKALKLEKDYKPASYPVTFWDVFGEKGHQVRATVSDMGPLLLSRLLNLNETQEGVLSIVFRIADDNGLLLLDLKDLRSMLTFVSENASKFTARYGNVSGASVGAIQRGLLMLEDQGADRFFGEPMLSVFDFIRTDSEGRGFVNVLASDKLMGYPKAYATFLLWLLSELYENLPEVGDLDKPKLVFFFDEAHLLFKDIPQALQDKVEQVIRLIRSKGVGIFFITQNPLDVPEIVLGQLGNRIQHALRAFTPLDQKAVKSAAQTFRENPKVDVEKVITELGVGEALVSFLDEKGIPAPVERALIYPPTAQVGAITDDQRRQVTNSSLLYGRYEKAVDRESAFELLAKRTQANLNIIGTDFGDFEGANGKSMDTHSVSTNGSGSYETKETSGSRSSYRSGPPTAEDPGEAPTKKPVGRPRDSLFDAFLKSTVRSVGTRLAGQIVRGILGSILSSKK